MENERELTISDYKKMVEDLERSIEQTRQSKRSILFKLEAEVKEGDRLTLQRDELKMELEEVEDRLNASYVAHVKKVLGDDCF